MPDDSTDSLRVGMVATIEQVKEAVTHVPYNPEEEH